jgi:hypothetical protein
MVLALALLLPIACESFSFHTPATKIRSSSRCFDLSPTRNAFFQAQQSNHREHAHNYSGLQMSNDASTNKKSNLPMLLDPGTKGGALFLSLVLFVIPIIVYEIATLGFGLDGIETGKWIGVGFTFFTTVLWVGTYIFRVATKDMTYVSQVMT